jgi:hypothetical protein
MSKQIYHWNLVDVSNDNSIMRYCHNCGKNVIFRDSKKRRRNANGKTIFEYAIYKCEKDHTWNMPVGTYQSVNYKEHDETSENVSEVDSYETFDLMELKNEGVKEIEIILGEVIGWKDDKTGYFFEKRAENYDINRLKGRLECMIRLIYWLY